MQERGGDRTSRVERPAAEAHGPQRDAPAVRQIVRGIVAEARSDVLRDPHEPRIGGDERRDVRGGRERGRAHFAGAAGAGGGVFENVTGLSAACRNCGDSL